MNRTLKSFFSLLFIILFAVSCQQTRVFTPWDLISKNAIAVVELPEKSTFELFEDSTLNKILPRNLKTISINRIAKDKTDLVCFTSLSAGDYKNLLEQVGRSRPDYLIKKRRYSRNEIIELTDSKGQVKLGVIRLQDIVAFSASSFLLEQVISVSSGKENSFKKSNKKLFQLTSVKNDDGNLYINNDAYFKLLEGDSLLSRIPITKSFAQASILDIKSNDNSIQLGGFSVDTTSSSAISRLKFGKPWPLVMLNVVPNKSLAFIHYGNPGFKSDIWKYFAREVGYCFMSEVFSDQILILKSADKKSASRFLSDNVDVEYKEGFSGYVIGKLKNADLFKNELSQLIKSASYSYYVVHNDYIFFSSSSGSLKDMITAVDEDDTWGKSVRFQNFHKNNMQEGNLTCIFNGSVQSLDPFSHLNQIPPFSYLKNKSITWVSAQYSLLDSEYYTNINVGFEKSGRRTEVSSAGNDLVTEGDVSSFFLVKNHNDHSNEILIQDVANKLYLVDKNSKTLWSNSLSSRIVDKVHQLDYLKNQKLQYFFTTSDRIFVLDRLGRNLTAFPRKINYEAVFTSLIDYDNSKNYRLLVAEKNKVHLMDKSGAQLPGWDPKSFDSDFLMAPEHYRIGGVDYFPMVLKNGFVHLLTRRGTNATNFPVKVEGHLKPQVYVERGEDLKSTNIYLLTQEGELIRLNLEGKADRTNLVREKDSEYYFCPAGNNLFLARINSSNLVVFKKDGTILFQTVNPGSASLMPAAHELPGKILFTFFDASQSLTYLFDESGKPYKIQTIETSLPVKTAISKDKSKAVLYAASGNAMKVVYLD